MNPSNGLNDSPSLDLPVLQRWFQSVITHPDGVEEGVAASEAIIPVAAEDLERIVTKSSRLGASERLAVYANAYHARLIECLGEVFPLVRRVVGGSGFADFVLDYLQDFPPQRYTLNVLGVHFPDYLAKVRPDRNTDGVPDWADFVIELARFEWEIFEVFDGPGIEKHPPFDFRSLREVPPDDWTTIHLLPSPCLRLLKYQFPINEFFSQARATDSDEEVVVPEAATSFVALTRHDFVVRRHSLSPFEFTALAALAVGNTLGDVLELNTVADHGQDGDSLADTIEGWFIRWGRERFFTGFTV